MLLAIDPGADMGWSLFGTGPRSTNELRACGLNQFPIITDPFSVLIERPRIYPKQKARPNDIITLALRAGECGGRFNSCGAVVDYVEPHAWKGNVPKAVHHRRVLGALAPQERAILDGALVGIAKSKQHNVLDAVGLGLFGVGR